MTEMIRVYDLERLANEYGGNPPLFITDLDREKLPLYALNPSVPTVQGIDIEKVREVVEKTQKQWWGGVSVLDPESIEYLEAYNVAKIVCEALSDIRKAIVCEALSDIRKAIGEKQ